MLAALLLAVFLTRLARLPGTILPVQDGRRWRGSLRVVLKMLPYWNWYGFPAAFIGMEALDLVGKFFLGAVVLGALMKRFAPKAA